MGSACLHQFSSSPCPICAEIERLRAEVATFQRACGCANGETLSINLSAIRHILRDGDGLQNPIEGIPDAAERVVRRAEKAEAELAKLRKEPVYE